VIDGKRECLPREVFTTTRWLSKEVSRSHSTWGNEVSTNGTWSHKQGRAERELVLNLQRNGASYSPVKAEQEE